MYQDADNLRVFAGRRHKELAGRVCDHLDFPLSDAKTDVFPDGELITRVEKDVRGRDCYVVLSTDEPVNDNLMELLIFTDCLRRASAVGSRRSSRTSATRVRTARTRGARPSPRSSSPT